MKIKETLFACFILVAIASCDSTKTLYTSSKLKSDQWIVNAYTMSRCGCTHLYVENFVNGRHVSQIQYENEGAVKRVFKLNDQGHIADSLVLFAREDSITVSFDSLDTEMFRRLKKVVQSGEGIVYELKWTDYKGYSDRRP